MNPEQKNPLFKDKEKKELLFSFQESKNPERVKALIGRTAKLNFHMLDPTTVELAEQRGKLPPGTFKALNSDPTAYEKQFVVKKEYYSLEKGSKMLQLLLMLKLADMWLLLNLIRKAQRNLPKLLPIILIKD